MSKQKSKYQTEDGFILIDNEIIRKYTFVREGELVEVVIESPNAIKVSNNGHRIITKAGESVYIPSGWISLTWQVKPGTEYFRF